ncbi:MAG: RebB family R body protein [Desulfatibacillum sp.]|nr:RebB family R body protein [Desulfatibacillum sp.]
MAFPTSVNNMITDSVTQANTEVVGSSPAMGMGNLFMSTSQALSNAAHNATTGQQQTNVTAQASTTQSVSTLFCLDTAATGKATMKIFDAMGTNDNQGL